MSVTPSTEPAAIAESSSLNTIRTRRGLAELLRVSDRGLCHLLYVIPKEDLYVNFNIPKKNGQSRAICAPIPRLKALQRRLLLLLTEAYTPSAAVYGFQTGRNIVGNANRHVRRRFVLNLDLEDFFPSINFGRVRGLLLAKPYECAEEVATVIAQICCYENALPQGAPTSPIVSNMICGRLDFQLARLARKYNCRYTRYADDITISSSAGTFPSSLATIVVVDGNEKAILSNALTKTIASNGFTINNSKTRMQRQNQRQVVTGLVTNKKTNLPREYIRNVRAMLRRWDREGLAKCQEDFHEKYFMPTSSSFKETLRGRIDFIGTVRGKDDLLYLRLLERLINLDRDLIHPQSRQAVRESLDRVGAILDDLWVVESTSDDDTDIAQSTGFFVEGFGIITCAHGILGISSIQVYRRDGTQRKQASLHKLDESLDLAILLIDDFPVRSFTVSTTESLPGDSIRIAGFPHFGPRNSGIVAEGTVIGSNTDADRNPLVIIDANILNGNSGGPVFDRQWNVVGVAARGNRTDDIGADRNFKRFIPISSLFRLGK